MVSLTSFIAIISRFTFNQSGSTCSGQIDLFANCLIGIFDIILLYAKNLYYTQNVKINVQSLIINVLGIK